MKKKSFYERIINGEFKFKSEVKEFSDFVYSCKDQLTLAKRIAPLTSKYYLEKTVRLKRDFKSKPS